MFSKLFKVVGLSFLAIFLLGVVALSVMFFKPTILVSAVNKWTDFDVVVDDLQLQVMPLSIDAKGLVVKSNKNTLVQGKEVHLSLDWKGYFSGQHTIWSGDLSNGIVDLRALPEFEESSNVESKPAINDDLSDQLHTILTALNGSVDNLKVILNDQSSLIFSHLSTELDGEDQQDIRSLKQNISLDLNFSENEESLKITGLMAVSRQNGDTFVKLELSEIDLSEMLSSSNQDQPESKIATSSQAQIESTKEGPIDWSWLKSSHGLSVELTSPKILIKDDFIEELALKLTLGKAINLDELSAKIDWALTEEVRFKDAVSISGKLTPLANETIGPDADLGFIAQSSKFKLSTTGAVNVNAAHGQNINLALSMTELPIEESGDNLLSTSLQQYLPLSLNSSAKIETDSVVAEMSESKFGESNLDLKIKIDHIDKNKPKLELALDADKISFQSPEISEEEQNKNISDKPEKAKLFNDEKIDFSFMQLADVDAKINIKEFTLNKFVVSDIKLPILLNDGESISENTNATKRLLGIDNMTANIADGLVSANVQLVTSDASAEIELGVDIKKLDLESLSLMPQDQLSGGNLLLDADLSMTGDSMASLAAASNGKLYLNVSDAIVQNDSFELIGSDLILGILNKLNPFSKSDPTTNLKCAAVYVPIKSGVAILDDSIAVQTSKLVIVAGGKIDLKTEELDLKFTPTSKAGIGVNVSSMVKFIKIGGSLSEPSPVFDAGGALASGLAAGAAVSTGGVSLLASGLIDKVVKNDVCGDVRKQYLGQ